MNMKEFGPPGGLAFLVPPIDQPMTTISIMLLKPFCRVSGSGEDLMSLERGGLNV